jgi:hypothetical protein
MCLKCKTCKTSDLGVIAKEIKVSPVRMTDGKIVAALAEPTAETLYEVNYCFTCQKAITEKDLTDKEVCPVCGKEVDELHDGMCPDCKAKADEFANMSKEELLIQLLKKDMEKKPSSRRRTQAKKTEETKVEETKVQATNTEVAQQPTVTEQKQPEPQTQVQPDPQPAEQQPVVNQPVNNQSAEQQPVEQKEEKPKNEPAPLEENQVQQAHQAVGEKVATTPNPTSAGNPNIATNNDFIPDVAVTQNENFNPVTPQVNAEDDIMKALNGLENFDINDAPF